MKWATGMSMDPTLEGATAEAADRVSEQLSGQAADLVVAFVSMHHGAEFARLAGLIRERFGAAVFLGCSAGGVIGGGEEIERQPGLALIAAVLPDVRITAFHIENDDMSAVADDGAAFGRLLGVDAGERAHFIVLPEPFTFESEALVAALDVAYAGGHTVGGLASGGTTPGTNALFVDADMHRSGAVGVALRGDVEVDTIVAQGCRPVGDPMFVTAATGNIVHEIDGEAAIDVVRRLHSTLDARDKELFRHSLFFGIVMDRSRESYGRGDFLIRNLLGVDENTGAVSVAAVVEENSVVQLHLRDAGTSSEDIDELLADYAARSDGSRPQGALMFSCLGRGAGLYGRAGHDSEMVRRHLGALPLGGFFCNGEIGEVGGRSFVHGYTSSLGLFRAASSS